MQTQTESTAISARHVVREMLAVFVKAFAAGVVISVAVAALIAGLISIAS